VTALEFDQAGLAFGFKCKKHLEDWSLDRTYESVLGKPLKKKQASYSNLIPLNTEHSCFRSMLPVSL
jgi:hypothetical protein